MTTVVFSSRAYLDIVAETYSHPDSETGGVLLGRCAGEAWYVLETIDPGYSRIHRSAGYFEYDQAYTTHLANIRSRVYRNGLELLGLWHRHPGSFDRFSSTDAETHRRYTELRPQGVISILVNLDPDLRLTTYRISPPSTAVRIPRERVLVGDSHVPPQLRQLKLPDDFPPRPAIARGDGARQRTGAATPPRRPAGARRPVSVTPPRQGFSLGAFFSELAEIAFGPQQRRPPHPAQQPAARDRRGHDGARGNGDGARAPTPDEDRVLEMVEAELDDYLEAQRDYAYSLAMENGGARVTLEYLGSLPGYPRHVEALLFVEEGRPYARIGDRTARYRHGTIRGYVEAAINRTMAGQGGERMEEDGPTAADHAAALGLAGRFSRADVRRAYHDRMREYHPDNWVRENDPDLTRAATEATQRVRAAYDYFMNR